MARGNRGGIAWGSIFGALLIIIVLIVFSYLFWWKATNTIQLNKYGCPVDKNLIPTSYIALIDTTTKLNKSQVLALENLGEKLLKKAPKYAEIKIYMMTGRAISKIDLVSTVCNPGDPRDTNRWTESQRQVRNNFNINYKGKLKEALNKIKASSGADNSFILNSIQNLALIENLNSDKDKKFFIVSDFIENDGNSFNFYKNVPDFNALNKSGILTTKLAALGNISVQTEVYMMLLPNAVQIQNNKKFQNFWRSYFIESGAALNNLDGKGFCIFTSCNLN